MRPGHAPDGVTGPAIGFATNRQRTISSLKIHSFVRGGGYPGHQGREIFRVPTDVTPV